MNLKVYQSFYQPHQFAFLDKKLIPYNNTANKNPELREYPIILDLYSKNKNYDGYWGVLSCRFSEKCKITGTQFMDMIRENPGYDVYHFNPVFNEVTQSLNPFINGDTHHPGMVKFVNRLMHIMGYRVDMAQERFDTDHFIYCSFYIGNNRFWEQWMAFLETSMSIANNDPGLNNYLYHTFSIHKGQQMINFSFVVERLVNLFLFLYKNEYKVKGFK